MTSVRSTEEPCAAKGAGTVLETSGGSDPLAEVNRALHPGVSARQVSQGSKNGRGAGALAAFTSVIRTLMNTEAGAVVETWAQLLCPPHPHDVPT
jgi:hypothetical protein